MGLASVAIPGLRHVRELSADMSFDISYEGTLDIFARLNPYSVKLNPQGLLNAQYLGFFSRRLTPCGIPRRAIEAYLNPGLYETGRRRWRLKDIHNLAR